MTDSIENRCRQAIGGIRRLHCELSYLVCSADGCMNGSLLSEWGNWDLDLPHWNALDRSAGSEPEIPVASQNICEVVRIQFRWVEDPHA